MNMNEKVKETGMKIKEALFGSRKIRKEMKETQRKLAQSTLDNVEWTIQYGNKEDMLDGVRAAKEANQMILDTEKAERDKIECYVRIGTTVVKCVVAVGLGVAAFELNKQMTLLVFNEQFSKGAPIDGRSLNNLIKANENLKRDILNNLNRKDGIL